MVALALAWVLFAVWSPPAKAASWQGDGQPAEIAMVNAMLGRITAASGGVRTEFQPVRPAYNQPLRAVHTVESFEARAFATMPHSAGVSAKTRLSVLTYEASPERPTVRRPPETIGSTTVYILNTVEMGRFIRAQMEAVCGLHKVGFSTEIDWKGASDPVVQGLRTADLLAETLAGGKALLLAACAATPAAAPIRPTVAAAWNAGGAWQPFPVRLAPGGSVAVRFTVAPSEGYVLVDPVAWGTASRKGGKVAPSEPFQFTVDLPSTAGIYGLHYSVNFGDGLGFVTGDLAFDLKPPALALMSDRYRRDPVGNPAAQPGARSLRYLLWQKYEQDIDVARFGGRVNALTHELLHDPSWREVVAAAAAPEIERIKATRSLPDTPGAERAKRFTKAFASYWKWGVDVPVKMTGDELGSLALSMTSERSFKKIGQHFWAIDEAVEYTRSGDILGKFGLAAATMELWLGMHDAVNTWDVQEAQAKFGFGVFDNALGGVMTELLGQAGGLPGWYVNFMLSEGREILLSEHERYWNAAFARWAHDQHWVGGNRDLAALDKVTRAIRSGIGIEGAILGDLEKALRDPKRFGEIYAVRGEDLMQARGLAPKFVRSLIYSEELQIDPLTSERVFLTPKRFYATAVRKVLDEALARRAREMALILVRGEMAVWQSLEAQRYRGRFRLVRADDPAVGVGGLPARRFTPEEMADQPRWTADPEGWIDVEVSALDFTEAEQLMLAVEDGSGEPKVFFTQLADYRRVTP
ncbi:MAG: hypothetical protein RLO51_02220 [Thalassobaculum sp.]|uniref:hypothetical protein n=1 Tax=Thalassobaculum sp. TaxID=2022740 RepID=UPI0032F07BF1